MNEIGTYVRTDDHGVLRVGGTHVMLDSVVAAFQQGYSAETIRQQFPSLRLEEVYGAITYYLSHAEELRAYLQRQDGVWQQELDLAEGQPNAVAQRLRATQHARAA